MGIQKSKNKKMNQKISTKLGIIIIVIMAVTAGMFVWKIEESNFSESELQSFQIDKLDKSKKDSLIEISDKWTTINHGNFWNNPNLFSGHDYKFPNIEFSYPENWEFRCCGDMDNASEHFINLPSRDNSSPYIRITDYVMSGCPDSEKECSMDNIVKLTAKEKFNRLVLNVPRDKILQEMQLKKLNTSAFVYKKIEKDNKLSKAYIINLVNDVIEIDFINYELLDEKFIENFLNHISFE